MLPLRRYLTPLLRRIVLIGDEQAREVARIGRRRRRRFASGSPGSRRLKSVYGLLRQTSRDGYAHELAEIDENLIRANLSPAEEAAHIAQRKVVYGLMHPETKHGGASKSARSKLSRQNGELTPPPRFTKATADATGKKERVVQSAAKRGAILGTPLLNTITGTCLDKPGELDALAQMPPEARQELADRAKAGEM